MPTSGTARWVAGLLHLVAPTASILPLKAFGSDGTGNLSDIIRAIYYAAANKANVVNMSFEFKTPSQELGKRRELSGEERNRVRGFRRQRWPDGNNLSSELRQCNGRGPRRMTKTKGRRSRIMAIKSSG